MAKVDVAILHSPFEPEPQRAAWMANALRELGATVLVAGDELAGLYRPGDNIVEVVKSLSGLATCVMMLLSRATASTAGLAYVQIRAQGGRPMPVQVEACTVPTRMADIMLARIYGIDNAADLDQLDAALRAGLGLPRGPIRRVPFPGQ